MEVDLFVLSAENEAHLLNELQSAFRLLRSHKKCYLGEKETFKETLLGCKSCASYFFKEISITGDFLISLESVGVPRQVCDECWSISQSI